MAIGWLTFLAKNVPWSTVISNAPVVAEGAKKLWKTVAHKPPEQEARTEGVPPGAAGDAQGLAGLDARIAALESGASSLHDQLLASTELIKALADQNTELIERVETHRIRLLWLARGAIAIAIVAVLALALVLLR
jgi:hypothetical protein